MPVSTPTLDQISGAATCQLFAAGAGIAAQVAMGSAITGQIWGIVGGSAGLLAANALAAVNGCFANPNNPPPGPGKTPDLCKKVTTGYYNINRMQNGDFIGVSVFYVTEVLETTIDGESYPGEDTGYPDYNPITWTRYRIRFIDRYGEEDEGTYITSYTGGTADENETIAMEYFEGAECEEPLPPPPDPEQPVGPPVEVPVPDTECFMSVQIIDTYINASGSMSILYEGCLQPAPFCEGCQRWWYHGPGQIDPAPPEPIPGPDDEPLPPGPPDAPWPKEQLDRIEECACQDKPLPVAIPGGEFVFTAACNKDDEGNLEQKTYPLAGAGTIATALTALASRQDQIMQILQQHLDWKTPTCSEKPELRGSWVTVRFKSDAPSPLSTARLRKLFRYRSESGLDLGQRTAYWADFTYTAGPVCVIHSGAWWGTPQVWASSGDEGKRVIRHAAGEAGLNPDQVGRWQISGSDNPRYGMPGQMRVAKIGGLDWVTDRDGPDGWPEFADP